MEQQAAKAETLTLTVERGGARLDKYVTEHCAGISRTRIQKLIDEGLVSINGVAGRAGQKLEPGDKLHITIPATPTNALTAEDIPLTILFEDADVLVIDKPAGLTVHPAPGHSSGTLANALLSHVPELTEEGDSSRPGIVHRLDKDTSGVMLAAKNSAAQVNLSEQFRDRTVSKTYIALVHGKLSPQNGVIEAPIGRDSAHRQRMAVVAESRGRHARTEYHVKEYIGGYSLLEVHPETGRTHQIRVHLTAIGHPIVGDNVYGAKSEIVPRQFLHAYKIRFRLPSTGEEKEFTAEMPADLQQALAKIRTNASVS